MRLSIMVAMSENGVIGRDNGLPWRLSADLRRFKQVTTSHAVIMGRRTFDSMDGPLPGRTNIVVTRQPDWSRDGAVVAHSLDDAIREARQIEDDEIFILGGGEIYRQAIDRVDRMYVTLVHAQVSGDTFFPEFDRSKWRIVEEEPHDADEKNDYAMTFLTYDRAG